MSRDSVAHRRKELIKQLAGVVEPIAKLQPEQAFAPHDEALLERARTQWQFGDWDSLAQLNRDALQHHPARAELALLAAAGKLQTGENHSEARRFIHLAQNWGASKKLISRILIAGVHNNLGRAAAIGNQPQRALQHFENAIAIGIPGGDAKLLTQARIGKQIQQLSLSDSNAELNFDVEGTAISLTNFLSRPAQITEAQAVLEAERDREVKAKEIENLKVKLARATRPRGGLDDMIDDIEPFFYGRRLAYIDVGAYIGDVFLKLLNSKIKIREAHLIEPNPHSFSLLTEKTSSLPNIKNLHRYNMALGQQEGRTTIRMASSMTKVISEHTSKEANQSDVETIETSITTLDAFIENTTEKHIDLLKIDVEGFEDKVLSGASKILSNQLVDVIVIEVGMNPEGRQQCYYRKIDDILVNFRYRVFKIYEQMFEWISDSPFLRRANFVYMSARFAATNPYRLTHELHEKNKTVEQLKAKIYAKVDK